MRRAIVPIGMPWAGATSLQTLLSAYRPELTRAGVCAPDLRPRGAGGAQPSHQYPAQTFDGRRLRRELREWFKMLVGKLAATSSDIAILSHEGLWQLSSWHDAPSMLRELLECHGFEMEIVVLLKAQDLTAQSYYSWRCQALCEPRFFLESLPGILRQRSFNYLACVRPWAIAAAGRVLAVPVHERGSSAPLIERLLRQLGLADRIRPPLQPEGLLQQHERSVSPAVIEIARRICARCGAQRSLAQAREIMQFVAIEARLRGFASTPFQPLDGATRERVMAGFAASNDRFARSIWGENWPRRVADVELAPVNAFGPDLVSDYADAQLDSVVLQVCQQFGLTAGYGLLARARTLFELPRSASRFGH